MKISQNLPQFKNSSAMIIVAGWQVAKIYHVADGELEVVGEIEIEKVKHSDNEGFFASSARNVGQMHSGAPLEDDKKSVRNDFLNELLEKSIKLTKEKDIKEIYIFSPSEGLAGAEEIFPIEVKSLINGHYAGNYLKNKPFDLLKMIQDEKPEPVSLMTEEAKKILKKGK